METRRHRYMKTWRHGDMETRRHGNRETGRCGDTRRYWDMDMATSNVKRKTEAQAIFLNPLTVGVSCKRKFVVYLFVDEETNAS